MATFSWWRVAWFLSSVNLSALVFSVPLFLPLRGSAVGCCRRTQHCRVFSVCALCNCRGILLGLASPRVPLVGRGWIWWWGLRLLSAGFAWLWWALAVWLGGARGFPNGWGVLVRSWNLLYFELPLILFLYFIPIFLLVVLNYLFKKFSRNDKILMVH